MARTEAKARGTRPGAPPASALKTPPDSLGAIHGPVLARKNYVWLAVALGVILVGFVALAAGDITVAPILLVTGYLVLVPLAILKR
jgi:hypothetical protein